MSLTTELSNMSYTNKDFNSIYTELLEYAKKLSYKWDPTASDESDPGVVLLKLAAIIGDKDSYNIDKNILELMPASVTQLSAARQLFEQCGYSMRYYRAAEGDVKLTIKTHLGDDLEESTEKVDYSYTLPQFTMFSDLDNSVIYTTKESATLQVKTETAIPVIEGTIVKYTVNNDDLITMQNIDSNNRLYFTEENIAENGIFITTVDSTKPNTTNYEDWKRVENLQTQPRETLCYKFGVTIDSSVCYIEFPEDIESLLGEGLHISYILTNGSQGNISAGKLKQFYIDTKFTRTGAQSQTSTEVDATIDKVTIKNSLPILNGQDPESIDDAYKNYKRVRDTFDTLVSLKDYSDYLVTSNTASNGFVCDRTNDIQRSYKVVTTESNKTYVKTVVETEEDETEYYTRNKDGTYDKVKVRQPKMNAFNLCAYALEFVSPVDASYQLKSSFNIVDLNNKKNSGSIYKDDSFESLQHDYIGFEEPNKILMLKNKYPINANIVPRYPLSEIEKYQVFSNVEKAMCNALNSRQMSFGEGVSIDTIQNAIINSDERIKTLIDFVSPKYETYAVYKDNNGNFKELRIDDESDDGGYVVDNSITSSNYSDNRKNLHIKTAGGSFEPCREDSSFRSSETYYRYDDDLSEIWSNFRTEIFAKNVLAGVTPLYTEDSDFTHSIFQTSVVEYKSVETITPEVNITLNPIDPDPVEGKTSLSYSSDELKQNENILLTSPNLVEENNFSSYVKVLYYFHDAEEGGKIDDGSARELKANVDANVTVNDFIMFFWKTSDSSEDYNYVKYTSEDASLAKFVCPSGFSLPLKQNRSSSKYTAVDDEINKFFSTCFPAGRGTTGGKSWNQDLVTPKSSAYSTIKDASTFVAECLNNDGNNQVLTGTKVITMKNLNSIKLNNKENGCQYFSWILNKKTHLSNGETTCTLFENGTKEYTLKSGEYFFYTDDDKTTLYILGEGTKLNGGSNVGSMFVKEISYDKILLEGIDYIDWHKLPRTDAPEKTLTATEQQKILIGPKNTLKVTFDSEDDVNPTLDDNKVITFGFDGKTQELKNCSIWYEDSKKNRTEVPTFDSLGLFWTAHSILNLNMSSTNPQKLESNHRIKITSSNNEDIETIENNTDGEQYLQCSESLSVLGDGEVDTASLYGSKSTTSLLSYQCVTEDNIYILEDDGTDLVYDTFSNTLVITLPDPGPDYEPTPLYENVLTWTIKGLLEGTYLLSIIPSSDTLGVAVESEGSNSIVNFNDTSNTYKLTVNGSETVTIKMGWLHLEKGATIRIPPLFKYNTKRLEEIGGKEFEERVLTKMSTLDYEKSFDYSYKPKNPIVNPLISTTFLKKNHFYNQYTICEWDADVEDSITVHDVVR